MRQGGRTFSVDKLFEQKHRCPSKVCGKEDFQLLGLQGEGNSLKERLEWYGILVSQVWISLSLWVLDEDTFCFLKSNNLIQLLAN